MEPDRVQVGGGQAGRIALVADEDPVDVVADGFGEAVGTRRVEPPLEHVALDDVRARDDALGLAVVVGSDVDDDRPGVNTVITTRRRRDRDKCRGGSVYKKKRWTAL